MNRRVVVTGLGILSALATEVNGFWEALRQGACGIRPLQNLPAEGLRLKTGAQILGFNALPDLDPFAAYFVEAGRAALADSGLSLNPELGARTAIVSGTAGGGQWTLDREFLRLYGGERPRVHPTTVPRFMPNAGASHLATVAGVTGPVLTVSTACSSATHAIGQAYWMVRGGMADLALAGGSEAPFSFGYLKAWEGMRVVAPDFCRPFSKDRKGMSLGEGAGVLVLETWEAAQARGAPCHAEVVGFGMSSDAGHITRPRSRGRRQRCARLYETREEARKKSDTSTLTGPGRRSTTRSRALPYTRSSAPTRVLSRSVRPKSMHGHALGAAGGLEAVATILALRDRTAPPTIHFIAPDPDCDLNVVPNEAQPIHGSLALSNSFAFGGLNAVVAFDRV